MLGVSDGVSDGVWAALGVIGAALIAAVASLVNAWKTAQVHREVKSPNGMPTATITYDAWKATLEVREQLAEVREAQLAGWERAHADVQRANEDRVRLEGKVDSIARSQNEHRERDERRFYTIFRHLNVDDPASE